MRPDRFASMDNTKQQIVNLDTKSQLAKLIATENIEVQHNKVKTASFDTLNRILTLPLFKQQSGDVEREIEKCRRLSTIQRNSL